MKRDLFIKHQLSTHYLIDQLADIVCYYSTFSLEEGIDDLASKNPSSQICIQLSDGRSFNNVPIFLLIKVCSDGFLVHFKIQDSYFLCGTWKSFDFIRLALICGGDKLCIFLQKFLPEFLVMNIENVQSLSVQVWLKLRKLCTSQ